MSYYIKLYERVHCHLTNMHFKKASLNVYAQQIPRGENIGYCKIKNLHNGFVFTVYVSNKNC